MKPEYDTIALNHENTWPREAVSLLDQNHGGLHAYHVAKCQQRNLDDIPPWRLREKRNNVVEKINDILKVYEILGFQCTRLHPSEIERIIANGLHPLSPELLHKKIGERVEAGDLTSKDAERLLETSRASEPYRSGQVCLTFTEEVLGSWFQYYRYWGGEALYHPTHNAILASIGLPCIELVLDYWTVGSGFKVYSGW